MSEEEIIKILQNETDIIAEAIASADCWTRTNNMEKVLKAIDTILDLYKETKKELDLTKREKNLLSEKLIEYIECYEGIEVEKEELVNMFERKAEDEKLIEENENHIPRLD